MIQIPVSIGELIDKITILEIKKEKIKKSYKLEHITKELDLLLSIRDALSKDIIALSNRLYDVNCRLWEIEDAIRIKESKKEFDEQFISLARSVYMVNDLRAEIKQEINEFCGSQLFEAKSYEQY